MAERKTKAEATPPKTRRPPVTSEGRASRESVQTTATGDSNRLLREAAWSRMFGRIEAKNPFSR